jgi:hypothetical protein
MSYHNTFELIILISTYIKGKCLFVGVRRKNSEDANLKAMRLCPLVLPGIPVGRKAYGFLKNSQAAKMIFLSLCYTVVKGGGAL